MQLSATIKTNWFVYTFRRTKVAIQNTSLQRVHMFKMVRIHEKCRFLFLLSNHSSNLPETVLSNRSLVELIGCYFSKYYKNDHQYTLKKKSNAADFDMPQNLLYFAPKRSYGEYIASVFCWYVLFRFSFSCILPTKNNSTSKPTKKKICWCWMINWLPLKINWFRMEIINNMHFVLVFFSFAFCYPMCVPRCISNIFHSYDGWYVFTYSIFIQNVIRTYSSSNVYAAYVYIHAHTHTHMSKRPEYQTWANRNKYEQKNAGA